MPKSKKICIQLFPAQKKTRQKELARLACEWYITGVQNTLKAAGLDEQACRQALKDLQDTWQAYGPKAP